jgi:hypothetical protein
MNLETKAPIEIDGTPLPAHLTANFEKAERVIQETYGKSPSVPDLARMWLASATSWDIKVEFERTVLSLKRGTAKPNKEGNFDEDSFEF